MNRDDERHARASETPIVGSLPEVPGILVAMRLSAPLAVHLRGLADELLVRPFPGSDLTRAERELLATAVSAGNDCFYCMDSHGAFASELLGRASVPDADALVDAVKAGGSGGLDDRMRALMQVARVVGRRSRDLTAADVARATGAGASDGDVQLAVLIASGFSMYNRMVDVLRSVSPASAEAYRARAAEIADHGYSAPQVTAVPR